jgi:hypothetical protein
MQSWMDPSIVASIATTPKQESPRPAHSPARQFLFEETRMYVGIGGGVLGLIVLLLVLHLVGVF